MTIGIEFFQGRPIGKTRKGEEVVLSFDFFQMLVAMRDRIGGLDTALIAEAAEVTDQTAWATYATETPTDYENKSQLLNASGRLESTYAGPLSLFTGASAYRTPINPLSSADVGTTATVSIASHTMKVSGATAAYNSGSVTGLGFATAYFIWAYDPTFAGGAVTYVASTSSETYIADANYIYVGYITTVADGGGGGSSPPPPPEYCVAESAWMDLRRRAGEIGEGARIEVLSDDMASAEAAEVDAAHSARVLGVRLISSSGVRLTCSLTTPITQPCGSTVRAIDARGGLVAVKDAAGLRWEPIVHTERVGEIRVRRIHVGGRTYAAGDEPDRLMFTHNPMKP